MVHGLSPNYRNGERHTAWTFCPFREMPGTCHTTKMGSPTLVLITHFAAEIMLIAFLNQGCERPSSGFKCHLTADVAECIGWIYTLSWHINVGANTMYFWDDNSNLQRTVSHTSMTRDTVLRHVQTTSCRPPVNHICRHVRSHSLMQRKRCGW